MPLFQRPGQPDLHYHLDDFTDPWRHAPLLILQHGNGRSAEFWYRSVPYLSRFYKVVRPDMRGLGKSGTNFD
ncbi:MAG: alpha/beta hydrolase, partial [Burkholderiales bacterium]|nr:alpha/beta hydrolase [Burkholderiales bacterium]